jgi:hypothetical protein
MDDPTPTRIVFTGLIAMVPPREDGPALALCPSTRRPMRLPDDGRAHTNADAVHHPNMVVTRTRQAHPSGMPFHPPSLLVPIEGCVVRLTEHEPRGDGSPPAATKPGADWDAFSGFRLKDVWGGGKVHPGLLPESASADRRISARIELWLEEYRLGHAEMSPSLVGFTNPQASGSRS